MRSAATPQKMLPIGNKIWSRRSSCDSHRRAEMSPMGDKKRQVSESFGSSSVASLRTPPTWFPSRGRACAGEDVFTSSDRRPIRPQRPPEHPPLRDRPPKRSIGLVTAKHRIVTACQTRQWRCIGETHVRFVRSSLGIGSLLGGCSDQGHPFCTSPTVEPLKDVLQVRRVIVSLIRSPRDFYVM